MELVLAEDGTAVDTEGFLGALPPHTPLVALGPGQRWEPPKVSPKKPQNPLLVLGAPKKKNIFCPQNRRR